MQSGFINTGLMRSDAGGQHKLADMSRLRAIAACSLVRPTHMAEGQQPNGSHQLSEQQILCGDQALF